MESRLSELQAGCAKGLTVVLAEFYEWVEDPGVDVQETNISVWREGRDCNIDLREDSWSQGMNEIIEGKYVAIREGGRERDF